MSAAWRAGAVHVVGRRACAGCGLSQMSAGTRGAARTRWATVGKGEGRGGVCGGGGWEGGRGRRLQKVPVRKDFEQKDLMMGLT